MRLDRDMLLRPAGRGDETYESRFWSKVSMGDGCWEWTAGRFNVGYGQFHIKAYPFGAHVVSWTLVNGQVPPGLCVLHKCDNRPCVRPDHLFLGTKGDNARDMAAKGRCPVQTDPARMRGERHPKARLTSADVAEIRRNYAAGAATQHEIARAYGMSRGAICSLLAGRNWPIAKAA